jgi:hypothetical protein
MVPRERGRRRICSLRESGPGPTRPRSLSAGVSGSWGEAPRWGSERHRLPVLVPRLLRGRRRRACARSRSSRCCSPSDLALRVQAAGVRPRGRRHRHDRDRRGAAGAVVLTAAAGGAALGSPIILRCEISYSTTSSALSRIDCGTFRPSALAVLAFKAISNLTGS